MKRLLILAALAIATPAFAQTANPAPAQAESPANTAAIKLAEARGRLIRAYDQAAWHGTDAMLAEIKDPASILGGYIADGPADAPRLTFYTKDGTRAVYVAQFRGETLVSARLLGADEDRSLSPGLKAMIAARAAGLSAVTADPSAFGCTDKPFNTVVLPPDYAGGSMLVYLLTPQTETVKLPFGGHFRVEVGADGKVREMRAFSKSRLSISLPRPGDRASFVGVTHLLDPVPTEIHVFSSFATKTPLLVIIDSREKRYYSVANGNITGLPGEQFKGLSGF